MLKTLVIAALLTLGATAGEDRFVTVRADDLQGAIDRAQPGDIVMADPQHEIVIKKSVVIAKPLTLVGLRARLVDGLGGTQLLIVTADGVHISDFHLVGNRDSVESKERAALLQMRGSRFVIERGVVEKSSKDGVEVTIVEDGARDVRDGVVRDIVGYDNGRDHISISGLGRLGFYIRNLVVQNIRGYRSRSRGAVEVSDGTENITVQDIYAEDSVYGVDVQDHKRRGESNVGVRLLNIFARGCKHVVRTDNIAETGHRDLTLRNISGDKWPDGAQPIQISHTRNVVIDDVRIRDGKAIDAAIVLKNCRNVSLQAVTLEELSTKTETIRIDDCAHVRLRDIFLDATSGESDVAIRYRLQTPGAFGQLQIQDVIAIGPAKRIVLERVNERSTLDRHRIIYDPQLIDDRLKSATRRNVSN